MPKKVLFIDRDGTLVKEPHDEQVDHIDKIEFLPGVFTWLSKIARELDYELVLVSNQDGLGTASFPEHTFHPVHNLIIRSLAAEGIVFKREHIDKSFAHENLPTRKPGIGMLSMYLEPEYNLSESFVIGDRLTDIQLATNLGAQAIFIGDHQPNVALSTWYWNDIYTFLKNLPRKSVVTRKTSETDIRIELVLDGSGKAQINTGIGFFDHMLHQLAKHGGLDVLIQVKGDTHIDEHHTIEDTALALGEAFFQALGKKAGIQRYGFFIPMDDCLAQVVVDFGGRPWLVWDVNFTREKIGEMPTEMMMHFFKSFSDTARCNLNIKAEGQNEHHKIEAIFKAWALAIKMAIQQTGSDSIPSTKGIL